MMKSSVDDNAIIEIDGSKSGGQVLRTALALSTLTGKGFSMTGIRAVRDSPGLKNQHIHILKAFKKLYGAKVTGDVIGSDKIEFLPGKSKLSRALHIDMDTAGSMTLVLQSLIMPLLFEDTSTKIAIKGGSDVPWSMPVDYFKNVFLPHIERFAKIDFKLIRRGYFPKGNGKIEVSITPRLKVSDSGSFNRFTKYVSTNTPDIELDNFNDKYQLTMIKGISHASRDLPNVAERQANAARLKLKKLGVPVRIDSFYSESLSTGTGITIWAIFAKGNESNSKNKIILGADCLGKRGLKAEIVGQKAAKDLMSEIDSKIGVDMNLADNLIPYIAMFGGRIRTSRKTDHIISNAQICRYFGFNIEIKEKDGVCIISSKCN